MGEEWKKKLALGRVDFIAFKPPRLNFIDSFYYICLRRSND